MPETIMMSVSGWRGDEWRFLICGIWRASADARNFSRAAEALGLNASTVSRRIGRLEDELGLSLFERSRSGARLTTRLLASSRALQLKRADVRNDSTAR